MKYFIIDFLFQKLSGENLPKQSPFTTSNTEMSIITSNVCQINLSNENINYEHCCFQISKMVSPKNNFGISIYILSWKYLFEIDFRLLRRNNELKINNFLTNIWCDNWHFSIWVRKRMLLENMLHFVDLQTCECGSRFRYVNSVRFIIKF